jgi:uncharacterized protein YbaP (TraB family)
MRKTKSFLFLLIFIAAAQNVFAQKKYPSTFLWKISGNGLKKPSYIYGTMHLQDKELFNLGDSIYYALESVDGFSMEVDPVALMDGLLKTLNDKDDSPLLKDIIEEKEYKKLEKNIESKFGVSADNLTLKKIKKYIQNKVYQKKQGQMKTFMDMYLYNIAKKQNKKFAPVEDVEDQLSLMDDYSPKSMEKYLEQDSVSEENFIENFKNIYIQKNLTALAKTIEDDNQNLYSSLALVKRNIKMARRIDSLTKIRTSFIAIGAAHLPGDSGLIQLLQNRGFMVEPILSSKNVKPEEYRYKAVEKDWINVGDEDSLISLQMPIEPSYKPKNSELSLKMSIDLTDYSLYGFTAIKGTESITDVTKVSDKMMQYYKKSGFQVLSNKQITQNGLKGIEFIGKENNEYIFRTKVLFNDKIMVLMICGAQNKKYLYDENFERFFNSLKFNENVKPKEWIDFVNEENNYSIQLPKKPSKSKDTKSSEASTIFTYSVVDIENGASYLCQTVTPKIGYYFENDSTYYENYKKSLDESTKNGIQYFSPALLNNNPAIHFAAKMNEDDQEIIMQGYLLKGINSYQVLIAITPKDNADYPNVSSFFNSYKALPIKKTNWSTQEIKEMGITINAPATIVNRNADTVIVGNKSYFTEDKNTNTTFYIEEDSLSNYVWYKNDSAYYKSLCNTYMDYKDSIVNFTYDSLKYKANILLKLPNSDMYKKVHVAINGNKVYTLFSYIPESILNAESEQKFFKDYTFTKIERPTIFENRIKLLTDSLASNDSATVENAFKSFYTISFVNSDLPYLHKALLKTYIIDGKADGYKTISISSKIKSIADSSSITFVQNSYDKTLNNSIKQSMLEILADQKTEKSYSLLKKLLLNSGINEYTSFGFSFAVTDSLLLAKPFFPDVTTLYRDTILGGAIMQMANKLVDSNIVEKNIVLQNQEGILQFATHQIMVYKREKDADISFSYDAIKMLGRINNKQANDLLQKYLSVGSKWDKEPALVQLLKNDVAVPLVTLQKIATDNNNCTTLYEDLEKEKKQKYFPKNLLTQKKFAEGYLYQTLTGDYEQENPTLIFVGEKISKVKGVEKRFFLFKVKNVYDGEATYNLGIFGGYDKNSKQVTLKYEEQQMYFEEEEIFSQATINKIYEKFIKGLNENEN